MDSEDILADSFSIIGETLVDPSEAGIVRYGSLTLRVAAKVRLQLSKICFGDKFDILLSVRRERFVGAANTLLADAVFSPSLFLAEQIQIGKVDLGGKTVLELGSGAALPLILSVTIESHPLLVTLTDYPDETIMSILHQNLAANREQIKSGCSISAVGYAWGTDVSPLLSLAPKGYDVLILSDLLHFDSSHSDILSTITRTLKRSPDAWVYLAAGLYTHKSVREAFLKAGEEVGLDWAPVENDGKWRGERRVTSDGEVWTQEDLNARKANVVAWIGRWR
ncbi:unnamed protein product [Rhizoctonia solani]|uniref:Nicotinamide N-methyltransferase n=1 Tax=Rhizoctonia solani TaxID=456999 RepID=A0A8H3AG88_9AGAM|nr:unnamed protein product [Rhizoctonia solani]